MRPPIYKYTASFAISGHNLFLLTASRGLLVLFSTFYQLLLAFHHESSVAHMVLVLGTFLLLGLSHLLILRPRESSHISVLTRLMGERTSRVCAGIKLAFCLQMRELALLVGA